ncbi:MAG: adenylate kinase [candidate division WOR-3 bacterium]|nr:MAG: adenylate kinase [candidate division WOR-3 bacterium]
MKILLLGQPGVGKGTQSDLLAQHYHFTKFSMGDILRDEIAEKSPLGEKIAHLVNAGQLVPDDIVSAVVDKFIKEHSQNRILFDGYPRTIAQAKTLDGLLTENNASLTAVLEMHLDEQQIVERLRNRRYCPKCGRLYNYITSPPKNGSTCDLCHVPLMKRSDDDEQVIKKRLEVYYEQTHPLIDYYRTQDIYTQVDASGTQEEVFAHIARIIDAKIKAQ